MIEASELSKTYGANEALKSASFTIAQNEVVGLLGPNGAGKTTLMKILTGFLHPNHGSAKIDGIDVVERPLEVQQRIGYMPENAPLYADMVVQEYLFMMAELRQVPEERHQALVSEAVRRTGLEKYLTRPIGELSKGFRQRVGLAQAILHQPKVLILDEPTSGLDPSQIVEIRQLIADLAKHSTVLLSTHILSEVELTCERALIINQGQVCADAAVKDLQSTNAAIAAIQGPEGEVTLALKGLAEVREVTHSVGQGGFARYRIVGGTDDICPKIYDLVRERSWRLAELHADQRNLESVFRDIIEGRRAAA